MRSFQTNSSIVAAESRYEVIKLFRTTSFIVPTLSFPVIFYLFFGVAMGGHLAGGTSMGVYLIASYGAFGVIGAALSAFGASVALERSQGLLELKHATPMPLYAYITAKLVAAVLFSSIIVASLFATGRLLGGARIAAPQLATLFGALVAGTIPFALLGLTIGYLTSAQSAIAVLNLVYLPMSFLSGLWVPIPFLPKIVQKFAPLLPAFHLGQLALGLIKVPTLGTISGHLTALTGFTLLFTVTAVAAYHHDRRRTDA